jgi:hypothetical protein
MLTPLVHHGVPGPKPFIAPVIDEIIQASRVHSALEHRKHNEVGVIGSQAAVEGVEAG